MKSLFQKSSQSILKNFYRYELIDLVKNPEVRNALLVNHPNHWVTKLVHDIFKHSPKTTLPEWFSQIIIEEVSTSDQNKLKRMLRNVLTIREKEIKCLSRYSNIYYEAQRLKLEKGFIMSVPYDPTKILFILYILPEGYELPYGHPLYFNTKDICKILPKCIFIEMFLADKIETDDDESQQQS